MSHAPMKNAPRPALVLLLSSLVLLPTPALSQEPESSDQERANNLREAITEGEWSLHFRPRFELVDDDNSAFGDRDAQALTLRSSFKFTSADFHGFTAGFEVEDVLALGNELYNNAGSGSNGNGVTDRPVVADPDLTEINQAWLAYDFSGKAKLEVGRIEQDLGDQRFVGAVAWRQNHQSFDAASLETGFGTDEWAMTYLYLDQIHTVTGARHSLAGHLFDLRFELEPGTFGLSSQWLDYDSSSLSGRSLATTALNFTGSTTYASGIQWYYDLQWAQQDDYGNNADKFSHDYYRIDAALGYRAWTLRVGTENLEGDGVTAFQTPLATLHKFNGWADKFLATPVDGIEDLYIKLGAQWGAWQGLVAFHDFSAEHTSADYGTEIDVQVLWNAPWKEQFGLKLADYHSDGFSTDTTKAILFTTVSF